MKYKYTVRTITDGDENLKHFTSELAAVLFAKAMNDAGIWAGVSFYKEKQKGDKNETD